MPGWPCIVQGSGIGGWLRHKKRELPKLAQAILSVKSAEIAYDPWLSMLSWRLEGTRSLPLGWRYGVRELAPAFTRGSSLPRQEASLLQGKAAASRRTPYGACAFMLRGDAPRHDR